MPSCMNDVKIKDTKAPHGIANPHDALSWVPPWLFESALGVGMVPVAEPVQ